MRNLVFILIVLLATSVAFAGVTYTVVTSTSQDGDTVSMRVRTTVDGSNARIEILEGGAAPFTTGSWMLTRDGGRSFTVVDPAHKTFSVLTIKDSMNDVDARIERQTKVSNSQPEIARISQEAGPELLGYATSHAHFRTTYVVTFTLVDSFTAHVTREDEVWAAPALKTLSAKDAPALSAGAQMGIDPLAGHPDFRQLGFPLKRITETKSESVDGTIERSVTTMEVTDVKEGRIDAKVFEIPADFKKIEHSKAE